ncbi:unnamed protein product [marine sediment metagenome]|uniref:PIN domain-containing protein n=1 Tax=marine sediment metagenome TaxID=412755 RepID=X1C0C1_9ZZZZ
MIFFDVNIFVDVLSGRKGFKSSIKLIDLVRNNKIKGFISSLTVPLLWFVLKSMVGSIKAQNDISDIIKGFNIVNLDKTILNNSFKIKMNDFEDVIQYCSAMEGNCKTIITRNTKDFKNFKNVSIFTPEEYLIKEGIKW